MNQETGRDWGMCIGEQGVNCKKTILFALYTMLWKYKPDGD